jgi:hypothetical protein
MTRWKGLGRKQSLLFEEISCNFKKRPKESTINSIGVLVLLMLECAAESLSVSCHIVRQCVTPRVEGKKQMYDTVSKREL